MEAFITIKPSPARLAAEREKEHKLKVLKARCMAANDKIFGFKSFRPHQLDIIMSVMQNEDCYVIMPTGGGKSLCYALPAVLSPGVTVVISPLLALIEDQVSHFISLKSGGIPAAYLTSTNTMSQKNQILEDLRRPHGGLEPFLKLLYLTPERVVNDMETREILNDLYQNERLARFVVDEAHCVSSWGHDFRKDYSKLNCIKEMFPEAPIVALTATACKKVSEDTLKVLRIHGCRRFNTGYDRPNLHFEVRCKSENPKSDNDTLANVSQYILHGPWPHGSTGIVYCMTRDECEVTAHYLRKLGIKADYYHAGMLKGDKQGVQMAWLSGTLHVVCATIAYGMGIDKADVRYVLHTTMAKSVEGYYQEAGRAGRDGLRSECILYYHNKDVGALKRLMATGGKRVPQRDLDRLQDMAGYCTEREACRRRIFLDQFGSESLEATDRKGIFRPCGRMCDNCIGVVTNATPSALNNWNGKGKPSDDDEHGSGSKGQPRYGSKKASSAKKRGTDGGGNGNGDAYAGYGYGEVGEYGATAVAEEDSHVNNKRSTSAVFRTAASVKKRELSAGARDSDRENEWEEAVDAPFRAPAIVSKAPRTGASSSFSKGRANGASLFTKASHLMPLPPQVPMGFSVTSRIEQLEQVRKHTHTRVLPSTSTSTSSSSSSSSFATSTIIDLC